MISFINKVYLHFLSKDVVRVMRTKYKKGDMIHFHLDRDDRTEYGIHIIRFCRYIKDGELFEARGDDLKSSIFTKYY